MAQHGASVRRKRAERGTGLPHPGGGLTRLPRLAASAQAANMKHQSPCTTRSAQWSGRLRAQPRSAALLPLVAVLGMRIALLLPNLATDDDLRQHQHFPA